MASPQLIMMCSLYVVMKSFMNHLHKFSRIERGEKEENEEGKKGAPVEEGPSPTARMLVAQTTWLVKRIGFVANWQWFAFWTDNSD